MNYYIRAMTDADLPLVSQWAQREGFCPGVGDAAIYRDTDRTGVWIGVLDKQPVGCIAGVRYDENYGFVGMFIVAPEYRGQGYGLALWKHALDYLKEVHCVGLEAALERINDYAGWGFTPAYYTRRYALPKAVRHACVRPPSDLPPGLQLLVGKDIPEESIQIYDAHHEVTPRPHFLHEWLQRPEGKVIAVLDQNGVCRGYGQIRPCLLLEDTIPQGWRIGPLLADHPDFAGIMLDSLLSDRPGSVLVDVPAINNSATALLEERGFSLQLLNLRMYKGNFPTISLDAVYGLASLELG